MTVIPGLDWDWYVSTDGGHMWHTPGTREAAIEEGHRGVAPGGSLLIAQASPKGPYSTLFDDAPDIAAFIDDQNEENAFEDAFTEEADLSTADLAALAADLHAVWTAFLDRHKPTSNRLDVGPAETMLSEGQ